jgi:hypothetical protein
MSAQSDPHAELGVPPNTTAAEVHQAFRRRLREHHPDTRPQHDDKTDSACDHASDHASDHALQRVLAAYETLRQRPAGPALDAPTEGRHHKPHRHGLLVPSGSLGDPPFTATEVQWVQAGEALPSHCAGPDRTSLGVPKPDVLIRWLLGG